MRKYLTILILLIIISLNSLVALEKQDTSESKVDYFPSLIYIPNIGEHAFTPNSYIDDPFISQSLMINLGYTNSFASRIPIYLNLDIIDSIHIDDTLYATAKLMYLTGSISFRQQINDWSALSLELHGAGRIGASTLSLIFQGLSTITGFEAQWLFNLINTNKTLLTASIGMNNQSYTYVNIYKFIKDVADSTNTRPAALSQTFDALYSKVGLSYAHGFTDLFGIIASGNLGYGELPTKGFLHDYFYDVGVYLDFHLQNAIDWPIGIGIGTKITSYPLEIDEPRDFSRAAVFKIAYNSKRDFLIGIETYYLNIPGKNWDIIYQFFKAQFNIQLYF